MLPTIDESLCIGDDLCALVCPTEHLIRGEGGVPKIQAEQTCVSCGHCVAVCPTGAVAGGAAEALPSDWRLDPTSVSRLLRGRRSIRVFREETLPRETLTDMIGVAQYAPSGQNSQPLSWTVISGTGVRRIAEATVAWMRQSIAEGAPMAAALNMPHLVREWEAGRDLICRKAPHLIVAHAPAALTSGAYAAAIAITYLELAALPLGVGTCWAGFVLIAVGASLAAHDALGLPEGQRCAGVLMAGRPAVSYLRIPERNPPRIHWR